MQTLTANQAKTQFGQTLLEVQKSPVRITKNGQPVAMMVSIEEFERIEKMKLEALKSRVKQAEKESSEGNAADGEAFFETLLSK